MGLVRILVAALAAVACGATLASDAAAWDALRRDGAVALVRHGEAPGVGDPDGWKLDDCTTQRNLNERGVAEARKQSTIVASLGIPAGTVYVSRYCRARDHVRWFTADVTPNDALTPVRNPDKAKALLALLATPPAPGANTFFFAHGGILWQATDYDSEEAETFVLKPGSPPTLVAAIKMRDWDALAAQRGPCCAPRTFWGGGPAPKE